MSNPAIVVIAYNRDQSLKRLLRSLSNASYAVEGITLHISIDASENPLVKKVADDFEWKYGNKVVDLKSQNLGLKRHILESGELTQTYGSIIMLEDDLFVAPEFYNFSTEASEFYASDDAVAGVSLYSYRVEENNFYPFQALRSGSDIHFIQVASSWGQCWTNAQWSSFKSWLSNNPHGNRDQLPEYIQKWGDNSWKQIFINYLLDENKYFAFPNHSYSTNFEDDGTNISSKGLFQVELQYDKRELQFELCEDSKAVYDCYFELTPKCVKSMNASLSEFEFDVDLYGTKDLKACNAEHLLTTRKGTGALMAFGGGMRPLFQNIQYSIDGNEIVLIKKANLLGQENGDQLLKLSQQNMRNQHYWSNFSLNREQVTVVVPVLEKNQLQLTIDHLENDRFFNVTLLICSSREVQLDFPLLHESVGCSIRWVNLESLDINILLKAGFEAAQTDFVSWVQAGMQLNLDKFEKVGRLFSGMTQVNFLSGIDKEITEKNYLKTSSAKYRITPQLANKYALKSGEISSELMVWRKPLLSEVEGKLRDDYSNLFIELLKVTPLYIYVDKLGNRNGVQSIHQISKNELKACLGESKYQPKIGFRFITQPIFKLAFDNNLPFFRLFYKEMARLPLVVRYDFEHDSFYLDNY